MNIADRIQYLRKQKGYSQEELADKVGVSRQAVSKWESEQSTPDLEKVIAMSELFEVTTDYILKGIEPVSTTNRKTVKTLYLGFVLIFATIAGIWSFAANRFNYDEIIMIILAGGVVGLGIVADGLFCREIDGLFCRSSPDIIVRRRCVLSHKRRGWLQPSPSFRYSRNLALQDELYHPVINNGPAVLVCVDKRLGTGPVNQSRDAG